MNEKFEIAMTIIHNITITSTIAPYERSDYQTSSNETLLYLVILLT